MSRRWSVPDLANHGVRGMKEKSETLLLDIGLLIQKNSVEIANESELIQFMESKTPSKLTIVIKFKIVSKFYQIESKLSFKQTKF